MMKEVKEEENYLFIITHVLNIDPTRLTLMFTGIFEEPLIPPATPKCVEFLSATPAGTITEADSWHHARRHPRFFPR